MILTDRDKKILQMTADGKSARQVGGAVSLSARTVEALLDKLRIYFDAGNKIQMVAKAIREKIIE